MSAIWPCKPLKLTASRGAAVVNHLDAAIGNIQTLRGGAVVHKLGHGRVELPLLEGGLAAALLHIGIDILQLAIQPHIFQAACAGLLVKRNTARANYGALEGAGRVDICKKKIKTSSPTTYPS